MAQLTGSNILNLARIKAQDNDTVNLNYAVGDTDALTLLNDVILKFVMNVRGKFKFVPASTSGFAFSVGQVEVTSLSYATFAAHDIIAAYPTNSASDITGPWPKELQRVSSEEIRLLINDSNNVGTVQNGSGSEWTHYALEQPSGASGDWRMYVWPPLSRARWVTLKTAPIVSLSALSDTPDMTELDARHVASFLALELLQVQRVDDSYLQRVAAGIPKWMRDAYAGDVKEQGVKQQQGRNTYIQQEA